MIRVGPVFLLYFVISIVGVAGSPAEPNAREMFLAGPEFSSIYVVTSPDASRFRNWNYPPFVGLPQDSRTRTRVRVASFGNVVTVTVCEPNSCDDEWLRLTLSGPREQKRGLEFREDSETSGRPFSVTARTLTETRTVGEWLDDAEGEAPPASELAGVDADSLDEWFEMFRQKAVEHEAEVRSWNPDAEVDPFTQKQSSGSSWSTESGMRFAYNFRTAPTENAVEHLFTVHSPEADEQVFLNFNRSLQDRYEITAPDVTVDDVTATLGTSARGTLQFSVVSFREDCPERCEELVEREIGRLQVNLGEETED
jgi:hypothetical protein